MGDSLDFSMSEFIHDSNIEWVHIDGVVYIASLEELSKYSYILLDNLKPIPAINELCDLIVNVDYKTSTIIYVNFLYDGFTLIKCSIKWNKGFHRGIGNACTCVLAIRDIYKTMVKDEYDFDLIRATVNWYINKLKEGVKK